MAYNSDEEAEIAAAQDTYNERLAVAVLRDAIGDEGIDYVLTQDGQFWLDVAGVSPEAVAAVVGEPTPWYMRPFMAEARVR